MRVVFFTPSLASNSLGRTYSLWLLTEALGWEAVIIAPRAEPIWEPLAESGFADRCIPLSAADQLDVAHLFIAVKPTEQSFGVAQRLAEYHDKPLLLDIDDPDIEAALSWRSPVRRLAKGLLRASQIRSFKRLRRQAKMAHTIVSNPILQKIYGGEIIPHVREQRPAGPSRTTRNPMIVFVGTNRKHKGLHILRRAVERRQDLGYTLTITDQAPADAKRWERWIGTTSLAEGLEIVDSGDVVVIPSTRGGFARGQLPAKLVDAMLSGRAIIVTDIEPMPWALGAAGITIRPSSVSALATALGETADPARRETIGVAAHERAVELFSVESNSTVFAGAARAAIDTHQHGKRSESR